MTSRTMPAAGMFVPGTGPREGALAAVIAAAGIALRSRLAAWSKRRRLSRSIAHLDARLLADAGLSEEHRGMGDRLIRNFASLSEIAARTDAKDRRY